VTEYRVGADNKVEQGATFKHTILLSGAFGDSPAIKKLAHWLSHVAYLGCGYCLVRGTVPQGGRGMYFKGYDAPTSSGAFAPDELRRFGAHSDHAAGGLVHCGDADAALDDQAQCERAAVVDYGDRLPADVGSHGTSPFVRELDYVNYTNLFVVPVAHAGLLGVVKDFWYHLLQTGRNVPAYVLSTEARRVLQERAACLVPTGDFGRQYTDIISKKGDWTMEDWLHWAECWSVFMLRPYDIDGTQKPVLEPMVAEMWGHLRTGCCTFVGHILWRVLHRRLTLLPSICSRMPSW
jgi:hypothetical protein